MSKQLFEVQLTCQRDSEGKVVYDDIRWYEVLNDKIKSTSQWKTL